MVVHSPLIWSCMLRAERLLGEARHGIEHRILRTLHESVEEAEPPTCVDDLPHEAGAQTLVEDKTTLILDRLRCDRERRRVSACSRGYLHSDLERVQGLGAGPH